MRNAIPMLLTVIFSSICAFGAETIEIEETVDQSLQNPCVAFDWRWDFFMVAWQEKTSASEGRIAVQRLTEDGDFLGSSYYASQGVGGIRTQPDIAYDPHTGKFLIVYVLNDTAIWGRFCYYNGTLGSLVKIVSSSDTLREPAVTYDPVLRQFLVAYVHEGEHTTGTVYSQIFVQRLTAAGSNVGTPLAISDSSTLKNATGPAIASVGGQSLILWEESDGNDEEIQGCMLEDGAVASGVITLAGNSYSPLNPAVAVNERTQEYLVTFQGQTGAPYLDRIYGLKVQGNFTRGAIQTVASDSSYNLYKPSAAYDRQNNQFVVAWSAGESGTISFGSKVQCRRTSEYGNSIGDIETLYSESGIFSGSGSADVAISDTDIALVPYRTSLYQSSTPANLYRIEAWRDEHCIDADINCDHDVNLSDLIIIAESWLIHN